MNTESRRKDFFDEVTNICDVSLQNKDHIDVKNGILNITNIYYLMAIITVITMRLIKLEAEKEKNHD